MVGVRGPSTRSGQSRASRAQGLYGWQGQLHDRLTRPMIRNGTSLVEASWDQAMDLITSRSRSCLTARGRCPGFYTSAS